MQLDAPANYTQTNSLVTSISLHLQGPIYVTVTRYSSVQLICSGGLEYDNNK